MLDVNVSSEAAVRGGAVVLVAVVVVLVVVEVVDVLVVVVVDGLVVDVVVVGAAARDPPPPHAATKAIATSGLPTLETRLTLLEERGDALSMVFGLEELTETRAHPTAEVLPIGIERAA